MAATAASLNKSTGALRSEEAGTQAGVRSMRTLFTDRHDAGRVLAGALDMYAHQPDVIVLGLPRGGVVVAFEVAQALHAPLDVFVVRKLGVPGQEELAMGAIASGGVRVLNRSIVDQLRIDAEMIDAIAEQERRELERRESLYRGDRPPLDVHGHSVLLIDDGLATGSTMRAAVVALRQLQPRRLVVGVPVSASETCDEFRSEVDDIVCARTPEPFLSVGMWYEDFSQTTDQEVRSLLAQASQRAAMSAH
jgi:putative phosphoribosyl transferase